MKKFLHPRDGASKGAALIIVLALVVIATGLGLAYLTRTTTDRQLAQTSYHDTSADLLARSALDITVGDLKREIANNAVDQNHIQPLQYGVPPITDASPIPNLIRRSFSGDPTGRTSSIRSDLAAANGRSISLARWNSHYLIPKAGVTTNVDSTPVSSFTAPYWVLVTAQGPSLTPAPNAVIGRYAFAVYDEGGLIDINLGGVPTYASLTLPTLPGWLAPRTRSFGKRYPSEESEIMFATCQAPNFTPQNAGNITVATGNPVSLGPFNTNHNPDSFGASFLPHGLSINTTNGSITGIPTSPGTFTITLTATNQCGTGTGFLNLTINGFPSPDSTPWPVNLARKGTWAFADVATLPATPTVITPTTPASSMGNFFATTSINKLMGWRNYASTQQPTTALFDTPSFPSPAPDTYARYFLGATLPLTTGFTAVSTTVKSGRTDQAVMTRQELIKLQRTICTNPVTGAYDNTKFPQSLLQYLGTFSREWNRPAPDWPGLTGALAARWDMNNLALVIPDSWRVFPGQHGIGHAYGLQRNTDFYRLFGLLWVTGNWGAQGQNRFTDPDYYGHWKYDTQHKALSPLPANDPDFFQIIDYAMNQANGGTPDPNHVRNTFAVGAAIIDQYDTDDLVDPAPGQPAGTDPLQGNTITIIDTAGNGNFADYVYGIEGMSYDDPDPTGDSYRPPFAPGFGSPPLPANYALLNRRFENVGEFGYAYNPASTTTSNTLDFASSASKDKPMLDFFTYNTGSPRAGIVNLNTRNGPVLASIIKGAWLHDHGAENPPPNPTPAPAYIVSQNDALNAGQAIVQETTNTGLGHGPALNRGDVARLAAAAAAAVPNLAGSDEAKKTIARAFGRGRSSANLEPDDRRNRANGTI